MAASSRKFRASSGALSKVRSKQGLKFKWKGHLRTILKHYQSFYGLKDVGTIERAFWFSAKAHEGQKRADKKTDYFSHPVFVAGLAAQTGSDAKIVAACLLHDVAEDCNVSFHTLRKNFGREIAGIVDFVSKPKVSGSNCVHLHDPRYTKLNDEHHFPKGDLLRLASSEYFYQRLHSLGGSRPLFVKLFDNLHNMQTITNLNRQKREVNISECLKYNLWIAQKVHPRLYKQFLKAVYKGLKSVGKNKREIQLIVRGNVPRNRKRAADRIIKTHRLFDYDYFRAFVPEDEKTVLVYHLTDSGKRFIRLPRGGVLARLSYLPSTQVVMRRFPKISSMRKETEKRMIKNAKGILEKEKLKVKFTRHNYPLFYRNACLFELMQSVKQLPNSRLSRVLGKIEEKHFKRGLRRFNVKKG
ncbi:MAG: HD domain-containing protein [Candidatus Micrarchaeia archaeon]